MSHPCDTLTENNCHSQNQTCFTTTVRKTRNNTFSTEKLSRPAPWRMQLREWHEISACAASLSWNKRNHWNNCKRNTQTKLAWQAQLQNRSEISPPRRWRNWTCFDKTHVLSINEFENNQTTEFYILLDKSPSSQNYILTQSSVALMTK